MSESYNSAGSPYWAFKAFLPLALPDDHPFWTAEETPAVTDDKPVPLKHPGMVMYHTPGNVVALSSGQQVRFGRKTWHMRQGAEKYCKFVYSSRYGFSVESDDRDYDSGAFDGVLAFSDDGLPLPGARGQRCGADRRGQALRAVEALGRRDGGDLAGAGQSLAYPRASDHHAARARMPPKAASPSAAATSMPIPISMRRAGAWPRARPM